MGWTDPERAREYRREWSKNRYRTDPEYRERVKAASRAAKASSKSRDRILETRRKDSAARRAAGTAAPRKPESEASKLRRIERQAAHRSRRRAEDPLFALKLRVRLRTYKAFKAMAANKGCSTAELLGAEWECAKAWIEALFLPGMTWANMGEWHIDHVVPLSTANNQAELVQLSHYTNLRPLWARDNIKRGARTSDLITEINHV